jgi:acetyl-CoA acetyltransferase family protein
MPEAVIVSAVRSAIGKKKGALSATRSDELLAHVLKACVERTGVSPSEIEDVITGCVTQIGEQGFNIARNGALMAGFPVEVTGPSVNRQCGSSQQALHFAAMAVMSGQAEAVIASGVESMTRVPMGTDGMATNGWFPPSRLMTEHYNIVPQHQSAEMVAEKWGISRVQCEELSLRSHQRAAAAREGGRFRDEIVPLEVTTPDGQRVTLAQDEGIRPDTTLEKMATLQPVTKPGGVVTAATSSQISDGAAAILVMSREKAARLGLKPRALVLATAVVGVDPVMMLHGPMPATRKVLDRAGLTLDKIDLVEINEAFASVPLAWAKELGVTLDRVNVNGGAIALGHPLGASGVRLLTTLLHELERRGGRYGLSTMCIGFGQATATVLDRKV